ncbi:MAG: saccharopine dehydrogenase NADP-binding domain-containing protein [Pseudomonadota bacterium]
MAHHDNKPIDIVVYGASGYTGRLVAEYLNKTYGNSGSLRWAMGGRNKEKLESVRDEIGASIETQIIVADSADTDALNHMAEQSKVILTTAGPYQLYGSKLIEVCAHAGTDYVDLCGEPGWMRKMIDANSGAAKASGARIVFSCGFDSIPFDLGVFFLQQKAATEKNGPCTEVKTLVRSMKGTFSGGTAASLKATMAAVFQDASLMEILKSPYGLVPEFEGPRQPSGSKPRYDEELGLWLAPFIMAAINTKNVHRSNALMGHAYGKDFLYSEMLVTGKGDDGQKLAERVAGDNSLMGDDGPKPGEGPTKEEREAGNYDILFIGKCQDGSKLKASVQGDMDPGYGSTSKMIAEAALCLINECPNVPGGILTPAPAMGDALIKRLVANAGLSFQYE